MEDEEVLAALIKSNAGAAAEAAVVNVSEMPDSLSDDWSHGYCDACDAIQPTRLGIGGLDESGQFELGELVCMVCDTIIATSTAR